MTFLLLLSTFSFTVLIAYGVAFLILQAILRPLPRMETNALRALDGFGLATVWGLPETGGVDWKKAGAECALIGLDR